jgi:exopolysaccharide biosynthesis polyprenyl glycosylphosphotransferase
MPSPVTEGLVRAPRPAGARERPDAASGGARALGRVGLAMLALDAVLLAASLALGHVIRFGLTWPPRSEVLAIAIAGPAWILVAAAWGLRRPHRLSGAEELRRVVAAVSTAVVLVWTAAFWWQAAVSRGWLGISWMLGTAALSGHHLAWRGVLERARARGRLRLRAAIVGTNAEGEQLARQLADSGAFEPVGFVWTGLGDPRLDGLPRLGDVETICEGAASLEADCLFVAASAVSEGQMLGLIRAARRRGLELRVTTTLPGVYATRVTLQPIGPEGGSVSLLVPPVRLSGPQAALKRLVDIAVSAAGLVLLSPVLAAIALAVKLDSPGPVLYRQVRATRHGRPFTMLKFRSMLPDAEADLRRRGVDVTRPFFKLEGEDPRITRVGRFLRRTSLDELPQLWNVLKGEMSLVGPRPLPIEQVRANLELLAARHEVRAGLTGWWQVKGRADLDTPEALRMDAFYVENWSLWLDLEILLRTVAVVLRGEGAR